MCYTQKDTNYDSTIVGIFLSVTHVKHVFLLHKGAFTKYVDQILPIFSPLNYPCLTFVQGSLITNSVVYELPLINLNSTFFSELPLLVGTSE